MRDSLLSSHAVSNKVNVFLGIALLYAPLPLGLRTSELSFLSIVGIVWLVLNRQINLSNRQLPAIFLITSLVGTSVSVARGELFTLFQFFRGLVFPILLIWLVNERITPRFFLNLQSLLPYITAGCLLSAVLYFLFGSDLYNSTLDIPYEDAHYKRFFVYPTYFFLILLFDAVRRSELAQIPYLVLLAASGSKAVYLSIVLIYAFFGISRVTPRRLLVFTCALVLAGAVAYYSEMLSRIEDFMQQGDPWRYLESLAAIQRLTDPIRFLIGNGSGIAYWEGRSSISDLLDEDSRVIINSWFDVHNGYLTLCLKFGVPLATYYLIRLFKSLPMVRGRRILGLVLGLNILLSHGPIQTVEAIGLATGIQLLNFRERRRAQLSASIAMHVGTQC